MSLAKDEQASLLEEFIAETAEHLAASEERLLLLESCPSDANLARHLLRSFHTIKGNSAYFEFRTMSELSHRLESLLTPVQNGEAALDGAGMQTLLSGVDQLRAMLTEVSHSGRETPAATPNQPAEKEPSPSEMEGDEQSDRYLIFSLNGVKMALPMTTVIEVTRAVPITPLPHVPAHVMGMVNLRGVVLPLIDLVQKLWNQPGNQSPEQFVVVPWGRGRLAIAVDRVVSMETLRAGDSARSDNHLVDLPIVLHGGEPIAMLEIATTLQI